MFLNKITAPHSLYTPTFGLHATLQVCRVVTTCRPFFKYQARFHASM